MNKCNLCQERIFIRNSMDDLMKLTDDELTVYISNGISLTMKTGGTFKIKFCPMCGKKLKQQNNE